MNATDLLNPGRKKARIEIIPLIDVVFFLLATFVLFTLSLDRISGLTANLPAGKVQPDPQDTTIFIQTSETGTVYWKQGSHGTAEAISTAELPARLAAYQKRVPVPRVMVRGDRQAKFGSAVQVFDQVRAAGIKQVSIETMVTPTGS